MREKTLEARLKQAVEDRGGWCLKFVSPSLAGVPDRLCLKDGRAVFVEVKAPGEKPRPLQHRRMAQLTAHGFTCLTLDNPDGIQEVLNALSAS